jgi:hypothetical protein
MAETRFHSLFERINNIDFHTCGYEQKLNLTVLQHVEYLIQQNLLRFVNVVVDILKHKEQ